MFYGLYRFLSVLLQPVLLLVALLRYLKGWECLSRIQERFGCPTVELPHDMNVIWIHCASVGESMSSLSLIQKIIKNEPNTFIVLTTMTKTAADIMEKKLTSIPRTVHQYVPYDSYIWVRRFVETWMVEKFISFESEFWPNMLCVINEKKIPAYLVNARVSERSTRLWRKYGVKYLGLPVRTIFKKVFAQTRSDAERLKLIGFPNVYVYGNLKYCAPKLSYNRKDLDDLLRRFSTDNIWLAASTHAGEEEILLRAHSLVKEKLPDALLIIAPRHTERGGEVKRLAQSQKFSCQLRTESTDVKAVDVYIADTMGELGLFYALSPVSFVAGSLSEKVGGHNIIEPAQLKSAVLYGPYMHNFKEVAMEFERHAIGIRTTVDPVDIADNVVKLLYNPLERRHMEREAVKFVSKLGDIVENIYWSILV